MDPLYPYKTYTKTAYYMYMYFRATKLDTNPLSLRGGGGGLLQLPFRFSWCHFWILAKIAIWSVYPHAVQIHMNTFIIYENKSKNFGVEKHCNNPPCPERKLQAAAEVTKKSLHEVLIFLLCSVFIWNIPKILET